MLFVIFFLVTRYCFGHFFSFFLNVETGINFYMPVISLKEKFCFSYSVYNTATSIIFISHFHGTRAEPDCYFYGASRLIKLWGTRQTEPPCDSPAPVLNRFYS